MFRFIAPTILIGISVALFFSFTNPTYQNISLIREEISAYNQALNNSKALEQERDKLTQKYNSIGGENLNKLQKLLPESIDNIRLVLEVEKLAGPYGMVLKDVQYDTAPKNIPSVLSGITQGEIAPQDTNRDYGVWNLKFSTEGTYNNFINFVRDLENNLRIVDIVSVSFSSGSSSSSGSLSDIYKYDFTIKTYWLKN